MAHDSGRDGSEGAMPGDWKAISEDVMVNTSTGDQLMPPREESGGGAPWIAALAAAAEGAKALAGKVADAGSAATSRIAGGARGVADGAARLSRGYTDLDVYNLGNYIIGVMDDSLRWLLGHKGELARRYPLLDGTGELEAAAATISAKRAVLDDSGACDEVFLYGGDGSRDALASFSGKLDADFVAAWDWVGSSIMSPRCDGAARGGKGAASAVAGAMAAAERLSGSIGGGRMSAFPGETLVTFSEALLKLAETPHGHPESYASRGKGLVERGEGWEDEHAGVSWMMRSIIWDCDYMGDCDYMIRGEHSSTTKTNREIGLDFVAWVDDIERAGNVLGAYGRWLSGDGLRAAVDLSGDSAHRDELDAQLRSEFLKAWDWIGRNIGDLWD